MVWYGMVWYGMVWYGGAGAILSFKNFLYEYKGVKPNGDRKIKERKGV